MDNQSEQTPNTPTEQNTNSTNSIPTQAEEPTKKRFPWLIIIIILSVIIVCGICIGLIVSHDNNSDSNQTNNNNITYNEYSIEYKLDNDDTGFISTTQQEPTKYEIFDNYSDYQDYYNSIDQWKSDQINSGSERINQSINERLEEGESIHNLEKYRQDLIDDYQELVENKATEIKKGFDKNNYSDDYFAQNTLVLVDHLVFGQVLHSMDLNNITTDNNTLAIQFDLSASGAVGGGQARLFFITISKQYANSSTNIDININSKHTHTHGGSAKPIIYLYPTATTDISVKLLNSELLTHSYPSYDKSWNVTAQPNGNLTDNTTGKNLYALYYENKNIVDFKIEKDGFVIKGSDTAKFLEEKLAILGLNERETEEFIIYWLPQLENNKYNYIRFATTDEINGNMPLEINPKPDTIIRILMTFKELDSSIDVQEQILSTPNRTGFTVVEWGGTEL